MPPHARTLLCILLLLSTTVARAQDRWLFVPVYAQSSPGNDIPIEALTAPWERAIGGSIANSDGATLVEAKTSDPPELSDDLIEQYTRDLDRALDQLATAHRKKAEQLLLGVKKLGGAEKDYLRRAPERAQMLYGACVNTAHLLLREKHAENAEQQMVECLRSFPGLKTSSREPGLLALIAQAQAALEREPHGQLSVQSQSPCVVRLNGLPQGQTPLTLERIPVGPLRVQVECGGAPGRIHTVDVAVGSNSVTVDTRLDAALRTRDGLALQYESASALEQQATAAATELGRMLRIQHVVLLKVASAAGGGATIIPQAALGGALAPLTFRDGHYDPGGLARALHLLQASAPAPAPVQPIAAANRPPAPPDDPEPENDVFDPPVPDSSPSAGSSFRPILAIGMTALGAVGLASGWTLYAASQDYRLRERSAIDASTRHGYTGLVVASLSTTFVGAALVSGAEFVWLPHTRSVPTWAWVVGGAGAVSAVTGIILVATSSSCGLQPYSAATPLDHTCARRTSDPAFGWTVVATSVPLLTLPLAYWLRSAPVEIQLSGASLQLRGTF